MQNQQQQRPGREWDGYEGRARWVSRTGSVAYETRRRILLQHFHKVFFALKSFLLALLSVASAVGFAKAFLPYALTATKDTRRAKQAESTGNRKKEKSLAICIRYN